MSYPTVSSAGRGDAIFLRQLRNFMEDQPLFSPEQLSPNGTSTEYRCTSFPIYDGEPQNFTITVGGVVQAQVDGRERLTTSNQVFVDYESGWVFWKNAPPQGSNSVQVRKSKVRWRDEKMLEALYTGLRMMFPRVWQKIVDSSSISLAINQWDYTLPPIFNDPRVRLFQVELQEVPASLERFVPVDGWRRVGNTILQLPWSQGFTPGSNIRLSFAGPYQALGDLEDQLQPLPLWYAKGFLLTNKEIVRVRQDTANVTQQETAQPVGSLQNAGTYYIREFENALTNLKRPVPFPNVLFTYAK